MVHLTRLQPVCTSVSFLLAVRCKTLPRAALGQCHYSVKQSLVEEAGNADSKAMKGHVESITKDLKEGNKIIRKKVSSKEVADLHTVMASARFFYGPLLESKRARDRRQKKELKLSLNNSSGLNEESQSKMTMKTYFNNPDYEKFAAMYSDPPSLKYKPGHTNKIIKLTKKAKIISQPEQKVPSCKKTLDKSQLQHLSEEHEINILSDVIALRNTESNGDLLQPKIENETSSRTKETSSTPLVISSSQFCEKETNWLENVNINFTDAPESIDLNVIKAFPLYNTNEGASLAVGKHDIGSSDPDNISKDKYESRLDLYDQQQAPPPVNIMSIEYRSSGVKSLPSVSKILNDTMPEASRIALAKWEAKMTAELGLAGFQQYKKDLFANGSLLHQCIQAKLQHDTLPSSTDLEKLGGYWNSIEGVVGAVKEGGRVEVLESRVVHPHLHYAGVVDCVAVYRETPVVVEWKTSSRAKLSLQSTYDQPLQVAAYLGALQHDPAYRHLHQFRSGLLAYSYSSGSSGHTHLLTPALLQRYWKAWLKRLTTFWKMQSAANSVSKSTTT